LQLQRLQALIETHSVVRVAEAEGADKSNRGGCNGSAAATAAVADDDSQIRRDRADPPPASGYHV